MRTLDVKLHDLDDDLPLLDDGERWELFSTGSLRLEFPCSVLRFVLVGNIILQVLFDTV